VNKGRGMSKFARIGVGFYQVLGEFNVENPVFYIVE
jgi:hypothetical protein